MIRKWGKPATFCPGPLSLVSSSAHFHCNEGSSVFGMTAPTVELYIFTIMFLSMFIFFFFHGWKKKKSEPRGLFGALRGLSNLLYAQCLALSTVAFVAFLPVEGLGPAPWCGSCCESAWASRWSEPLYPVLYRSWHRREGWSLLRPESPRLSLVEFSKGSPGSRILFFSLCLSRNDVSWWKVLI